MICDPTRPHDSDNTHPIPVTVPTIAGTTPEEIACVTTILELVVIAQRAQSDGHHDAAQALSRMAYTIIHYVESRNRLPQ